MYQLAHDNCILKNILYIQWKRFKSDGKGTYDSDDFPKHVIVFSLLNMILFILKNKAKIFSKIFL